MQFKSELKFEKKSRQKQIAEEFSNDKKETELYDILNQMISELTTILNKSYLIDDLLRHLQKIEQIITHLSEIPNYFIERLNIVSLFCDILQETNNSEIFEFTLIILQSLIYLSPDALDIFIHLDMTDLLLSFLNENSINVGEEDYVVSTILGIILKMSESQDSQLEINVISHIFNYVEICQNLIAEDSVGDTSNIFENLKICFEIFGSFIRYNKKEVLDQFVCQFLELNIFLSNPFFQKELIPIFCDMAEKRYINEIIESGIYQSCLNKLNSKPYEKSYKFIIRLIVQILSLFVPSEETQIDLLELNQANLNKFVPFDRIYELLNTNTNKKIQSACLLLYEKISSIGGLKILLDLEVNKECINLVILTNFFESSNYTLKSQVYHLLWEGILNLNNRADQIFIMNSPVFDLMTSYVDFQDNFDFLHSIIHFFEHILSINPQNSFANDSNQMQLNEEALTCINNFVNECIDCDNEDIAQSAKEFLENYF